jgi:hypothetical protein
VLSDETLTGEMISSGRTDPYVEMRIVSRLLPSVRQLLPAAVLLRRFDKTMLRPAAYLSYGAFDNAYRELGEQEWMDYQPDETLQTTFLEIDRKLFSRLLKYYRDPSRSSLLDSARRELAPALMQIVEERDLDVLGVDHVYAGCACCPLNKEPSYGINSIAELQGEDTGAGRIMLLVVCWPKPPMWNAAISMSGYGLRY